VSRALEVTLTALNPGGHSLTLSMPDSLDDGALDTVTLTWREPLADYRLMLEPFTSKNITQYRSRAGLMASAEAGAKLVQLSYQRFNPFAQAERGVQVKGVLSLGQANWTPGTESIAVVLYRAERIVVIGSGEVIG
jgi:hypothetical protein